MGVNSVNIQSSSVYAVCVCAYQGLMLWSVLLSFALPVHSTVKELAQLFSARPPSSFSLTYLLIRGTSGGGIKDQMLLSASI